MRSNSRGYPEITLRAFVPDEDEGQAVRSPGPSWPPAAARFTAPPTAIQQVLPGMSALVTEQRRGRKQRPLLAAPADRQSAPEPHLTGPQIAKRCGVSPRTVAKWIDSGQLRGYRLPGPNGQRRVPERELRRFCRQHGLPCRLVD